MNNKELNAHAFVAWLYLRECAKCCGAECTMDADFARLTFDMWCAYPDEFELLMGDE